MRWRKVTKHWWLSERRIWLWQGAITGKWWLKPMDGATRGPYETAAAAKRAALSAEDRTVGVA